MCTICLVNKKESTLCRLFCLLNKKIAYTDETLNFDGNATCQIALNPNEYAIVSVRNWSNEYYSFISLANNNSENIILKAVNMLDLSPVPNITVDARIFYCRFI